MYSGIYVHEGDERYNTKEEKFLSLEDDGETENCFARCGLSARGLKVVCDTSSKNGIPAGVRRMTSLYKLILQVSLVHALRMSKRLFALNEKINNLKIESIDHLEV